MYQNRYSGGSRGFQNNRRPSSSRRSFQSKISRSLYIKKALDFAKIEDAETVNSFEDFGFHQGLIDNIKAKGYKKPTEIQDKAIGHIINNKDLIGLANTGTGKTAAYVLPLIDKILKDPNERIIVLAPTRELAIQIKEEFRSFTPGLRVFIALAIGGSPMRAQIIDIRRGPNVIIGTPGRVKDLGKRRVIDFRQLRTVVLDEVDRMLDMGFITDVKNIIEQTPRERQTLFFSATLDRRTEPLTEIFLRDPVKVTTRTQEVSSHVEQNIVQVQRSDKERTLHKLVSMSDFRKVLVFGSTQMIVERLTMGLLEKGYKADGLHGGKRQGQRQQIVKSFREDRISILVATDVAARGLDIADITHVINYDEPNNYQDYIHRIGRTGRGNSKGYALTFVE